MTFTTRIKNGKEKETKETIIYRICEEIKYGTILLVQEEHPGYNKVCLDKRRKKYIPRIYRIKDTNIQYLNMENPDVIKRIKQLREQYAQENLILFLPFRTKPDLLSNHDDTYWTSVTSEKKDLIWKKYLT